MRFGFCSTRGSARLFPERRAEEVIAPSITMMSKFGDQSAIHAFPSQPPVSEHIETSPNLSKNLTTIIEHPYQEDSQPT